MAARAKIGDILEIHTPKGFAYAQVTHVHKEPPNYGHLLRIFDGTYQERPADLNMLINQSVQFQTFFPANAAINQNIVSVIGNAMVPSPWSDFPLFRVKGLVDPLTNKAKRWGMWDGDVHTMLDRPLTEAEKKLPILGVVNDTMLIERIINGWQPEYDIHT